MGNEIGICRRKTQSNSIRDSTKTFDIGVPYYYKRGTNVKVYQDLSLNGYPVKMSAKVFKKHFEIIC